MRGHQHGDAFVSPYQVRPIANQTVRVVWSQGFGMFWGTWTRREICEALVSKPKPDRVVAWVAIPMYCLPEIMHWSHKKKRDTYTILTRGISIYWIEITNFSEKKRTFLNESHFLHKKTPNALMYCFCSAIPIWHPKLHLVVVLETSKN